jgi:hypothetical protein
MKKAGLFIALFFVFGITQLSAKWFIEKEYKFRINVPSSWSANSFMDGTDKVYDFYSPDNNIAIQLRAFEAGSQVTTDLLVQIYEEQMLPAGTKKSGLFDKTSKNGIPGKQGVYSSTYNGTDVAMSAFYAVVNNYGYVLLVIVPTNMMQQKTSEIQKVTQSFMVDGFSASGSQAHSPTKTKPDASRGQGLAGLSGLAGSTTGNTNASSSAGSNVVGTYEFHGRSDGKVLVNYHYLYIRQDGTYTEKYQPKNSGNYVSEKDGTWSKSGNQLVLTHSGGINDRYQIERNGQIIKRTSSSDIVFTFGKR